jgi:hypothetical protein
MNVRQVVPRDAIPSVDDPSFVARYEGSPGDEVVAVAVGDTARAYPVRYLNYHEIVNDVVPTDEGGGAAANGTGGRPLAVTWCPLCGSAVVYDRTVDGRVLEFGVSGKLADDDLVMYDRETESEWKQSLGEAIAGPLAGTELDVVPAGVVPYERFAETHPDGEVLAPPGGRSEAAGEGDDLEPVAYDDDPYRDYFEADGFGLGAHRGESGRTWDREDLDPKVVVLGVEAGDEALGFPMDRVEDAGGDARARVGDHDVAVFVTQDGVHAFEADGVAFEPSADPGRFSGDGTRWNGATGRAADGRELDRLAARRLFAFAWQDDHGPDAFWEA